MGVAGCRPAGRGALCMLAERVGGAASVDKAAGDLAGGTLGGVACTLVTEGA